MDTLIFWGLSGAMVLGVAALMALAIRRGGNDVDATAAYDLRVYRDQLREVDRDLARGVVSADEAERLRLEIGRRVLSADKAAQDGAKGLRGPQGWGVLLGVAAMVAGIGLAGYMAVGRPAAPDLPLAQRLADADAARSARPSQSTAEQSAPPALAADADPRHQALMEQLRKTLQDRPNDIEGHRLLARNEAALGNFAAAYRAQARIVELRGAEVEADELALQADLMIRAAGGYVSPEAEQVLARTLQIDPRHRITLYFSGLMFVQNDRPDRAFEIWSRLWLDTREGDPWAPMLQRQLPDVAWLAGQHKYEMPPLRGTEPGPDAAQIEAAAEMTQQERAEMVRGMVDGLSARLATEGGPAPDWARLIRALVVLGETDRAQAIWAEAQQVFADKPSDLDLLRSAAKAAGLGP